VSDQHTGSVAERLDELDHVVDDVRHQVGVDTARLGRLAVAAQVGSHRAEPRSRERGQLPLPRDPILRKAVKEDDERPVALRVIVQLQRFGSYPVLPPPVPPVLPFPPPVPPVPR
jgi:hypothetical protein